MIYEPENLKNKRAIYEKRDKWLIRLAFLFWAVLLFIYVNIVIPYVKSTIGFLGIIVGGIAVITIVYFFTVFFVLMRRGRQFRKMNNDMVREYHENKNGELFLEKLLAISTLISKISGAINSKTSCFELIKCPQGCRFPPTKNSNRRVTR